MTEDLQFHFHRERKREHKDKVEELHVWVKGGKDTWALVYIDGKREVTSLSGKELGCDPDRIQLIPILEFLRWMSGEKKRSVVINTNSCYVVNVLSEWIDKWKRTDFKLDTGGDRPNADILREIDTYRNNTVLNMKSIDEDDDFNEKLNLLYDTESDLI